MSDNTLLALELLHTRPDAALATQSLVLPGFPYTSLISLVPDADGTPMALISRLAEHTRQLEADPHSSLLLSDPDMLADRTARLTVLTLAERCERTPARVRRFLRYLPQATDYLDLPDFAFWRFVPQRLRLVAGFGRMGWIDPAAVTVSPCPFEEEALAALQLPGWEVLGVDSGGVDLRHAGTRLRLPHRAESLEALVASIAPQLEPSA